MQTHSALMPQPRMTELTVRTPPDGFVAVKTEPRLLAWKTEAHAYVRTTVTARDTNGEGALLADCVVRMPLADADGVDDGLLLALGVGCARAAIQTATGFAEYPPVELPASGLPLETNAVDPSALPA